MKHTLQLKFGFGTGGPPNAEMMTTLEALKGELPGLKLEHASEIERDIYEGHFHTGRGAVVQLFAKKLPVSHLS